MCSPRACGFWSMPLVCQLAPQLRRQRPRRGDPQLAGVGARAGRDVRDGARPRQSELGRRQLAVDRRQVGLAHPAQQHVLVDGGAQAVAGVLAGDVGQGPGLVGRQVAEGQGEDGHRVAGLALGQHVAGPPGLEPVGVGAGGQGPRRAQRRLVGDVQVGQEGGPARVGPQQLALLQDQPLELGEAELLDQELDPRALAVRLLPQPSEHPRHRLGHRQQLLLGQELVEELGGVGDGAEPAPDVIAEAPLRLPVHHAGLGDAAHVVEVGQPAGLTVAAGEGHLELAPEVLGVVVPQQEVGDRVRVGRDVEGLGLAHAGQGAGGDVADGVAAGLAGGDPHRGQAAHEVRRVLDVDEVELEILAGRHVQDAVRVLLADLGQDIELLGGESAHGDLDPLHAGGVPHRAGALRDLARGEHDVLGALAVVALPVVVPLAVDAAAQARLREELLFYLSKLAQLNLRLENVDLAGQRLGHGVPELRGPAGLGHGVSFHETVGEFLQLPVSVASRTHLSGAGAVRRDGRTSRVMGIFPTVSVRWAV